MTGEPSPTALTERRYSAATAPCSVASVYDRRVPPALIERRYSITL